MRVRRPFEPDVPGPASIVTGSAWVRSIARPESPSRLVVEEVTFAPDSHTAWHTHPHGQLLLVTGGNGWLQARGEAAVQVGPGDVVWIEPGEEHWHGSLPDTLLRHILVQEHENDADVDLTGPLADGEYPPEQHRENPTNGEPA